MRGAEEFSRKFTTPLTKNQDTSKWQCLVLMLPSCFCCLGIGFKMHISKKAWHPICSKLIFTTRIRFTDAQLQRARLASKILANLCEFPARVFMPAGASQTPERSNSRGGFYSGKTRGKREQNPKLIAKQRIYLPKRV